MHVVNVTLCWMIGIEKTMLLSDHMIQVFNSILLTITSFMPQISVVNTTALDFYLLLKEKSR